MVSGGGTISKIWVVMTKNETKTINTFRNTKEAACVLVIVGVFFTSREEAMLVMVGVEKRNKRQETHQSCSSHCSTQWPTQSHKQYKNLKQKFLFSLSSWNFFVITRLIRPNGLDRSVS